MLVDLLQQYKINFPMFNFLQQISKLQKDNFRLKVKLEVYEGRLADESAYEEGDERRALQKSVIIYHLFYFINFCTQ